MGKNGFVPLDSFLYRSHKIENPTIRWDRVNKLSCSSKQMTQPSLKWSFFANVFINEFTTCSNGFWSSYSLLMKPSLFLYSPTFKIPSNGRRSRDSNILGLVVACVHATKALLNSTLLFYNFNLNYVEYIVGVDAMATARASTSIDQDAKTTSSNNKYNPQETNKWRTIKSATKVSDLEIGRWRTGCNKKNIWISWLQWILGVYVSHGSGSWNGK